MRTTIYINSILQNKLINASDVLNVSKHELVSILLSRIIRSNSFYSKPYEAVKYQDSFPDAVWKREHIILDPVFYEKALDFRRNFKFSVSWLISFAVMNYLDEIVENMSNPDNHDSIMDNYHRNFVYISKMLGGIHVFVTMMGIPEEKYLEKLLM